MHTDQRRPWCLFTSAGDRNAIDRWLKHSRDRRWDLVVAYYGEDDREFSRLSRESSYAFRTTGGKFQNLKKLVGQDPQFFDRYSHVWVCDDDIRMSAAQIDEVFTITETFDFWVSQPAFAAGGKNSHWINCYCGAEADWRIVNFVECGVAVFRRDKLMEFLDVYDGSLVGFGIDYWYLTLFGANENGRCAVIDKVQVLNPTDKEKGRSELDRLQPLEARRAAWHEVRTKFGLVEFPHKVYAYGKIAAHGDIGNAIASQAGESPSLWKRGLTELKSLQSMGWRDRRSHLGHLRKKVGLRVARSVTQRPKAPGDRELQAAHGLVPPRTLADRLGYRPAARLLIVHADDVAVTHSVNAAFIRGIEIGLINSGSVMVACPWFPEIVAYARAHPDADLGVHLALTSERTHYRWGPTAPRAQVPSLVDRLGYLHHTWTSETPINPQEVEIELRAQIEKSYAAGLRPTHLDSHQYRLQLGGQDLFAVLLRLGREYRLPVFVARTWFAGSPYLEALLAPEDAVIDHTVSIDTTVAPAEWPEFYRRAVHRLRPGVTELVIHPGLDDPELRAFSADRPAWGAAWRQRDLDFFTSVEFRALLATEGVRLITWREIAMQLQQREIGGVGVPPDHPVEVERE